MTQGGVSQGGTPRGGLRLGRVLAVVGVAALSVLAWRRLLRRDDDSLPIPVTLGVAALIVAGVVGVVWWRGRRAAGGQGSIAAQRPGWSLHQVWADATLHVQLVQQGVWEPRMNPAGGTRLTLAWSPVGIELWRAGHAPTVVLSLPWDAVASVREGTGRAASSTRPAAVISTVAGAELVVVPAAKPGGAMLPASRAVTAALVGAVRAARDLPGERAEARWDR